MTTKAKGKETMESHEFNEFELDLCVLYKRTDEELAEAIKKTARWEPALEYEFCRRASLSAKWEEAGTIEEIEAVLSEAAKRLKVEINPRVWSHRVEGKKAFEKTVSLQSNFEGYKKLKAMSTKELVHQMNDLPYGDFVLDREFLQRAGFYYKALMLSFDQDEDWAARIFTAAAKKLNVELVGVAQKTLLT